LQINALRNVLENQLNPEIKQLLDKQAKQVDDPSQSARAFYVSSSEPKD